MASAVTGLEQYKARLASMIAALDDEGLLECFEPGAAIIRDEVHARVPVGDVSHHVGKLEVSPGFLKSETRVLPMLMGEHRAKIQITFGRAFYWRMVEYGTSKRAASPFVRPAIEAKGDEARAAIGRAIVEKLLKAAP